MASQQTKTFCSSKLLISALFVGLMAGTTGCAVNPVFAHRFDHCVSYWKAYERGPQMTVYPEGEQMVRHCVDWANEKKAISILADFRPSANANTNKEG
jgi:hypothetical protein